MTKNNVTITFSKAQFTALSDTLFASLDDELAEITEPKPRSKFTRDLIAALNIIRKESGMEPEDVS